MTNVSENKSLVFFSVFFRSTERRSRDVLRRAKHVTSRIKKRDLQIRSVSSDAAAHQS